MFGLFMVSLVTSAFAVNWAVLVAGSKSFWNYRHQADIFHAYNILIEKGFDPEKIIVMAYDDIANCSENPYKGHVYNVPGGPDVYIGSDKIDYRQENVTAEKFLAVLKGDKETAGGKVLNATRYDNVFIFYDDHGGKGIVGFPGGDKLYADDLHEVLDKLKRKGKFRNLLFYMEACYAGSMFLDYGYWDIRVYAATASNERESSYAIYCNDSKLQTCLSDEFSHNWMVDTEIQDITVEEVGDQFENVRVATLLSHVSEYGMGNLRFFKVADFQSSGSYHPTEQRSSFQPLKDYESETSEKSVGSSRQEDVYMSYLEKMAKVNKFGAYAVIYNEELIKKEKFDKQAKEMAKFFNQKYPKADNVSRTLQLSQFGLYKKALAEYEKLFGVLNEHNLWSHSSIIYDAIAEGSLTDDNFKSFKNLLKQL